MSDQSSVIEKSRWKMIADQVVKLEFDDDIWKLLEESSLRQIARELANMSNIS